MSENTCEERPAYQLRVIEEKHELDAKIEKLGTFLSKETTLPVEQINLLARQMNAMKSYSSILGERLATFGVAE